MNHFIISYHGNKKDDYKHFKDDICYDNVKNIVEPFCGSSAISFQIWKDYKDKFSYHLNDLDTKLYNIYKILKEQSIDHIFDKINDVKDTIKCKEDFEELCKKSNKTIYEYIFINKGSSFRYGRFHERALTKKIYKATTEQRLFSEFLKQDYVHISNEDYKISYDFHKNNKDTIIFLDPPYINGFNTAYKHRSTKCYEFLSEDIKNKQAIIFLPLEKNDIVLDMFKDSKIIIEWNKIYKITKKKVTMILISN
jgi:site-specific DNA-adenine methylase